MSVNVAPDRCMTNPLMLHRIGACSTAPTLHHFLCNISRALLHPSGATHLAPTVVHQWKTLVWTTHSLHAPAVQEGAQTPTELDDDTGTQTGDVVNPLTARAEEEEQPAVSDDAKVFRLVPKNDDDIDLTPLLGEIARQWYRINPYDLNALEAMRLLGVLMDITDRLDEVSSS